MQFVLIGVVTIVYFLLAPIFARVLGDPSLTFLFRISTFVIPAFALASFYVYYFTGIQLFEKQAFLKFFRAFSKISIIIMMAILFSTTGAIIGHALAPFSVFLIAYFIDPYRKVKAKASTIANELTWKKLVNFAWPITLFMLFYELMITVDLYLVKILLKDDALTGIYNSAITVGRIPFYAFYFLTIILLPKISETTSQGLKEETQKILTAAMRFMLMLLIPSIALLSAFSPSAIRFFYGARYSDGSVALSILAFGAGSLTVFYVLAFVLNGAGKNKVPMWTAFFGCILNFFLVYSLIPRFGIQGAAIGTTITSLFAMLIVVIYSHKKIANFLVPLSMAKYFFASVIVYLIAANFLWQGRFIFILWTLLLLALYFIILYLLKELKKEDWRMLTQALKKKDSKT